MLSKDSSDQIDTEITNDVINHDFTMDLCDGIINLYEFAKQNYIRCVFIECNKCYICYKLYSKPSEQLIPHTYEGYEGHYGWIFCESCACVAELANYYKEVFADIIYYNKKGNVFHCPI